MKLSILTTISISSAVGSSRSTVDRSSALARNRPAGKYRLTDAKHDRKLQDYSTIDGYTCFRDFDGMLQAMVDLEANYPDLVSVEDIGDSYLKSVGDANGHDIFVIKITASTSDPAQVLFTGGHHARELAPPELLMRFAEKLVAEYDMNADITWILDTTQINIILYANPDGRVIAETQPDLYWRKNVNPNDGTCSDDFIGTDLNRNYDWMWGDTSGASSNPCDEDYHGSGPASEPEVQAVIAYAKSLFPEAQRKSDPVADMDIAFGEDITGLYMDVHSYGGLTYYPWGFEDLVCPDNDSLEALGRKASFFNGYVLWAGGQPDFLYPATGDASDYMYAHLGVASMGLEIGDDFYQDCDGFESKVYPDNLNTLLYTIKLAKKPNAIIKGPDVLDLTVTETDGELTIGVDASDSELVNIDGYPSFTTGEQTVSKIELYLDVLPDEYGDGDTMYLLQPTAVTNSDRVSAETVTSSSGLTSGRHAVYAVATDSDGYTGPVSSVFFEVENVATPSPVLPTSSPSILVQTTTFTTTTTETSALATNAPSASAVVETSAPTIGSASSSSPTTASTSMTSSEPTASAVDNTNAPTNGSASSPSPTIASTSMISSEPTASLAVSDGSTNATGSPTAASTDSVGSASPTTIQLTESPSITGMRNESEAPTLSPVPSVGILGDTPTDAFSEDGSSASNVFIGMIVPMSCLLITYLL